MTDSTTCYICWRTSREPEDVRLGHCRYCNAYRIEPGPREQRLAHLQAVILKAASVFEAKHKRRFH